MVVRTQIFTFKEYDLGTSTIPIQSAIHSAKMYVGPDNVVYVDLFCSYQEWASNEDKTLNLVAAVNGSYIDGDFVAYVCPLFLPDGGIGGLFAIL